MIKFEINKFPFALTNDQFSTIAGLVKLDPAQDYDVVEGDGEGRVWLWVHWEKADPDLTPTRYWVEADGNVSLAEDVDWDWQGVGEPTPEPEPDGPPEGMVAVEVEWFRGEQFAGQVWVEEGLEGDAFDEAVEDAIHNLSQPEENSAFAGCSEFDVTKKRIIPKEETNAKA
ncbi:hypothetical protein PP641_gp083 [Arthrobacter phage SilentRX]|uniref:Uncharacterized protein n=1 Tax=Arthrobacter phage SilentRX TaxID=2836091 RepID=A0A8F3IP71_9CAUD|nr:hypothetical protein PP641_gp083 [Arthrobacter phage SilentRX]QWY82823.1 hypothetical protein SEA_SILENTRX_83 [Arthrobacter phage SilentRX]